MQVTLPNNGGTINLVVYVVSSTKLYALSTGVASGSSASDLLTGQLLQQTISSGSFTTASLSAPSVVREERLTLNGSNVLVPDVQIGLFTFTGAGKMSLVSDEDNGGVITSNSLGGSYTVAANGRVSYALAAGLGGCTDCVSPQTFMYLVGAGQGFLMDFSTSPNVGYFVPQTATAIGNASLEGNYSAGTLSPLAQACTDLSESLSSTGAGALSGTADQNAVGTLSPDTTFTATYGASSTGRVSVATTGSGQVLYLISPTQALLLDLTATSPTVREVPHQ